MRASKQRRVPSALVRVALSFCACNVLAAALSAQCTNPTQVPNGTYTLGDHSQVDSNALVTSTFAISQGATATFAAGNCIHLAPGFRANAVGATAPTTFHAWTDIAPSVVSLAPTNDIGLSQVFTWTVASASGQSNLAHVFALFNTTSASTANACYIHYDPSSDEVYLADNTSSTWLGGFSPSGTGSVGNAQCTIAGTNSQGNPTRVGTKLGLSLNVQFQQSFSGQKTEYVYALDSNGVSSGWQSMGAWTVGNPVFSPIRISPSVVFSYVDGQGHVWMPDYGYSQNAQPWTLVGQNVTGTPDPLLYRTERWLDPILTYQFNVPNGNYTVTLKFAEIFDSAQGQRYMNIALNGTTVRSGLDVWTAAGAKNRAYDESYPVTVNNGQLTITLTCTSPNNSAEVNAIQIVAGTTQQQYSLTTSVPNGGGSTTPSCPGGCLYSSGSPVQITATPNSGYQFTGFTGVDSSSGSVGYVTMNSNRNVTATFTPTSTFYTLTTTASPSGGGTVSPSCPSGCSYTSGELVTITATPAAGYQFNGFTGSVNSGSNPLTVSLNGATTETANFTPIATQYQLTTTVSPAGSGTISPACPSGCSYIGGSSVSITALPAAGYAFSSFSGAVGSSSNPLSVTMNSPISEAANFTSQAPTIAYVSPTWGPASTPVTIVGGGWGSTPGANAVKFNGAVATVASWTATSIVAQVPSGATTGAITVEITGFTPAASPSSFTVSDTPPAGPAITGLSLTQGPPLVGFVITGSGFPGNPSVTLNGTSLSVMAATATCPAETCITVQVPEGMALGTWPVLVNGTPSAGKTFQVVNAFGCSVVQ
jgi:hypothetical protein